VRRVFVPDEEAVTFTSASSRLLFPTTFLYEDTGCGVIENQISWGSGVCVPITNANNGALSFMYNYDSTTNTLFQVYYTDAACTDESSESTVIDFSDFGEEGTCMTVAGVSVKYSIDDSLPSFPSIDGMYQQ
jgi:hypothetical protein